jgi:hypothetical protein
MSISVLIPLFCSVFFGAFCFGWWRYRSFFWNCVDVLYYPLAAIGVALLFLSNDVQRELFDVTQRVEQQSTLLGEFRTKKPEIKVLNVENLLTSNIEHLALISKWVEICKTAPSSAIAKCLAVKDIGPPVEAFLKVARGNFSSYEDRLLITCTAGDKLLEDIRASQAISSLVMDKLLTQYEKAESLSLSPLDYETINTLVNGFREQAKSYAEEIHRMAFKPDDENAQLLLDIRNAEIDYGEMIFRGLSQCLSAPKPELELLKKWKIAASTQEQEVAYLESQRQQLRKSTTTHSTSLWLQLNLWPLVLLAALSLKFAKGSATLRKAREDALKLKGTKSAEN